MPFNLVVEISNKDDFAKLVKILGDEGITLGGGCGFSINEKKNIFLLVDNAGFACREIKETGLKIIDCRPVFVLNIHGLPNRLGEIILSINNAEIDVDFFYLNEKNQLVLGVEEISKSIFAILDSLIRKKDNVSSIN